MPVIPLRSGSRLGRLGRVFPLDVYRRWNEPAGCGRIAVIRRRVVGRHIAKRAKAEPGTKAPGRPAPIIWMDMMVMMFSMVSVPSLMAVPIPILIRLPIAVLVLIVVADPCRPPASSAPPSSKPPSSPPSWANAGTVEFNPSSAATKNARHNCLSFSTGTPVFRHARSNQNRNYFSQAMQIATSIRMSRYNRI